MRRIAKIVVTLALLLPAGWAGAQGASTGQLSVTGEGRFATAPDMATVTLGAVSEAQEASEAIGGMRAGMTALLEHLEIVGVAASDIRTSQLSLNPRWDGNAASPRAPQINGYIATSLLTVRLREMEALGDLLDRLGNEANSLQGVSFGLQEPGPAQDEARRAAMQDAIHRAELYAEAAGVALGPILSISEAGMAQPYMMREQAMSLAGSGMPVAPGEVEFTASVTVTYALGAAE